MNNSNRGNNNRRRGRGNRQQGSGQQLNRIDSRARGNAPQLLEKYRKLAQDAHMNGDRVTAEYYLQFADHYFRVLADARVRQDETRTRPQGERWQEGGEEGEESNEFSGDNDFPSFDQPGPARREREERPRFERQSREDQGGEDEAPRPARQTRDEREDEDESAGNEVAPNPYEPPENPFVRDNPGVRGGLRPRRAPKPTPAGRGDEPGDGLDPALLPPAISVSRDDPSDDADAKPRRGRPRRKPLAGDAGETLESVN